MFEHIYTRYRGGCMMLLRREGEHVVFLGTAFLVHPDGYLLTVAHILPDDGDYLISPRDFGAAFAPPESETVPTMTSTVVRLDRDHDVALLKFHRETDTAMPDHIIGTPDLIEPGHSVACLGYPFGFYHVFNQCFFHGVVTAKVKSPSGLDLLLFDTRSDEGLRGAPLVDVSDGRIIGIVAGRFHPNQFGLHPVENPMPTGISYAVSIAYGVELMQAQGLEII